MRCQNCGRELKNGARFCIGCGAQHDENGQLVANNNNIGNNAGNVDYNKTMMASDMQQVNNGGTNYNGAMINEGTGFKQYQPQEVQQNDYDNNESNNIKQKPEKVKKGISPIIFICPVVIIIALIISFMNGKKKKVDKEPQTSTVIIEETIETHETLEPEESESDERNNIHLNGYWSADAEYFFENGVMQTNTWVGDYYVGDDGKKVVNSWVDNKYYVDETGKLVRNKWIEFSFVGENGQKKIGYYYADSDGKKVYNQIIDGRIINNEGCYIPNSNDSVENNNIEREVNDNKKNEEILATENKISQNEDEIVFIETSVDETSIIAIPTTTLPVNVETQIQTIINSEDAEMQIVPQASNENIISDGKTIAYQRTTESFPNNRITKYVSVNINDENYANLANAVSEWDTNRRGSMKAAESIIGDNVTTAFDIKVERNDEKVFSLYETKSNFNNNKEYEKEKYGYTWDSKTGELLTLRSIFRGDDEYEQFTEKVKNKLKSNKNSIDEEVYEEIMNGDSEEVYNWCSWYMGEAGITFIFNKNDILSNNINGLSFTLTYSESGNNINKLLQNKYRK